MTDEEFIGVLDMPWKVSRRPECLTPEIEVSWLLGSHVYVVNCFVDKIICCLEFDVSCKYLFLHIFRLSVMHVCKFIFDLLCFIWHECCIHLNLQLICHNMFPENELITVTLTLTKARTVNWESLMKHASGLMLQRVSTN